MGSLTLQVGGGLLMPALNKNGNFSTFSDPIELKKFDFSQKPMGMPLIPIWGLETAKKGVSIVFLSSAETISGS